MISKIEILGYCKEINDIAKDLEYGRISSRKERQKAAKNLKKLTAKIGNALIIPLDKNVKWSSDKKNE